VEGAIETLAELGHAQLPLPVGAQDVVPLLLRRGREGGQQLALAERVVERRDQGLDE
jgi:hypothetical protein